MDRDVTCLDCGQRPAAYDASLRQVARSDGISEVLAARQAFSPGVRLRCDACLAFNGTQTPARLTARVSQNGVSRGGPPRYGGHGFC
jgi:hypothetical protein